MRSIQTCLSWHWFGFLTLTPAKMDLSNQLVYNKTEIKQQMQLFFFLMNHCTRGCTLDLNKHLILILKWCRATVYHSFDLRICSQDKVQSKSLINPPYWVISGFHLWKCYTPLCKLFLRSLLHNSLSDQLLTVLHSCDIKRSLTHTGKQMTSASSMSIFKNNQLTECVN